jgi:protein O-mannosyl-transferase
MAKQSPQRNASVKAKTVENTTTTPSKANIWLPILATLAITFLAFTSSLSNKFVNWDDDVNIVENENTYRLDWEHVKAIFTSDVIGNYNPLPILTLAIERNFVGLEGTWLYHWTNLLLHLFCVYFVFRIAKKLGLGIWAAAFCALLFGIHPMRVESVAWVTERKDVLFAAFYLPALYLYIKYVQEPENRKKYYLYMIVLFFFALLSKVQAVALPLSMLCVDYYLRRVDLNDLKGIWKMGVEKIPFFLMSLAAGIVNIYTLSKNSSIGVSDDVTNYTFADRLLVGAYSFMVYLIKLVIPYEMSPLYPYPSQLDTPFFVAPLGVALVFAAIYLMYKKDNRAIVFGFLLFFFNVVFMLQIVGAGQGFIADRFTYIPYLGCFFALAYGVDYLSKNNSSYKSIAYGAAGIFIFLYAFMTYKQNKIWENGATLWSHVLKYYPDSDMALNNKSRYLRENLHDYKAALAGFNRVIQIKPTPEVHNSRGKTYFDMGSGIDFTQKALADYNAALSFPENKLKKLENKALAEIYINRGAAYGRLSEEAKDKNYLQNALADVTKGAEIDPKNKNAYLNGYLISSQLGRPADAIANINKYNELSPYEGDMYYSRGLENRVLGNTDAALEDFNLAISYGPENIRMAKNANDRAEKTRYMGIFHMERAKIYIERGNLPQAKTELLAIPKYGLPIPAEMTKYVQ